MGDLTVPLNGGRSLQSPLTTRVRKGTVGSEDYNETAAKLKIDMDTEKKGSYLRDKINPEFRFNAQIALRVAFGVLIASAIQTRDRDYDPNKKGHQKKWMFFPEWYFLGGLSYCAVAVIFSAGKNVGATIREVCQAFYGVGVALIYNCILFSAYSVPLIDPNAANPYEGYQNVTKTFSSTSYMVNPSTFYGILPWMMLFTVVILLLPIENNTKKFALGNNLYFTLTLINPNGKTRNDPYYSLHNIIKNLELYFLVGFLGSCISLFVMFVPYPIFAMRRLRDETTKAANDILDLLNLIVDSYCFKNKNVDHMNFLRLKLRRKFDAAAARHRRMNVLLEDVWWEQAFGFHWLLKFNRSIIKNYVTLVGSLISDLRSLNNAMQLEKYENLHFMYMKVLQREIYVTQMKSGELLNEISKEVHNSVTELNLQSLQALERQMEHTLHRYRTTQNRILRTQKVTHKDVEGNVPLNLFLFSMNSFCSTLINFQESFNKKKHDVGIRARSFLKDSIKSFFVCHKYDSLRYMSAFKVSMAIFAGIFLAVYVYAYSNTTPASVAYVMGNHIGGSFSVTVNRVGGVVAGSVVPSVFQFFIAQVCEPQFMNIFLSNAALFFWVATSMYVRFSGGYGSYAGLVSAFISAGILLRQSDICYPGGGSETITGIAISSYSSLAQTSVGILLFIVVELAMCPKSATSLLRSNIQETLKLLQRCFTVLFGHHLSTTDVLDEETLEELREILQKKVPAMLVEQQKLLTEANAEPMLWRPAFSYQKYESVLESSHRLLNNNNLLFKLVKWFNYRVEQNKVDLTATVDIREGGDSDSNVMTTNKKWRNASEQFNSAVGDTFDTLRMLFSEGFLYSDPEQTAIFMQMKEAFRLADKDCSGEIDADEVAVMLESIFAQSGGVKEEEIHKYVEEFMEAVDTDRSGKVSFEEFMDALENGLKLEVEVYHRRKPKASLPALQRQATMMRGNSVRGALASIQEGRESRSASAADSQPPTAAGGSSPPNQGNGRVQSQFSRSSMTPKKDPRGVGAFSPMCREHDVLNVEDFTLGDIADQMRSAYVEWLLEDKRFERVTMEELLLLNCLVSGAEGVARNLTSMEEIVVSS
ncbi:TPA: hypothetical protein N0F65_005576 [Lagenidium giganteum]|uniref:EF-hand domain-containing protein n=1 Tax=Lagenidium giganteum TaxID=4803 RepID=A0AAV2Z708_9STRA|nr:TPA: hypothetical protein N0F65_005576 [Lagenidium giganteum]